MNTKTIARNLLLAALIAAPALASAQDSDGYYRHHHHYYRHYDRNYRHDDRNSHYRTCGADRRMRANNGTAIGAVSGGVLGATLGGGVGNTLLGAGAGAVAGHVIGSSTTRC